MKETTRTKRSKTFARACYLTAIVNSLVSSSHGQGTPAVIANTTSPVVTSTKGWSPESVMRCGIFDIMPSMRAGVTYDDNIFITAANKKSDVVWSISPHVLLGAGDYRQREESLLTIEYSPTVFLFTRYSGQNTVDHDAKVDGQWHAGNWTLGLEQRFTDSSGTIVDAGRRVDRQTYNTEASATYEISPKTSVEMEASQSINDYAAPYNSFNEWVVGTWLDYWLTPKVRVGPGFKAGWVDVVNSANQTYQQALVRVSYLWSDKLELHGSVGGEIRQFQKGGSNGDPVFSLGGNYKPFVNTTLGLEGYRRNQSSFTLVNQNYHLTGVSGNISQVIRDRYTISLEGGYEVLDYTATQAGVVANRRDDYYFVRVGADWDVTTRFSLGAFYLYRQNNSNIATSKFSNNQVGLTAIYAF